MYGGAHWPRSSGRLAGMPAELLTGGLQPVASIHTTSTGRHLAVPFVCCQCARPTDSLVAGSFPYEDASVGGALLFVRVGQGTRSSGSALIAEFTS